jgi:hypothetical protein
MLDDKSILMRPGNQRDALWKLIQKLPKRNDLIGAEIGSYIGESAEIFVQSWKFKKFYCIDAWEAGYDPNDIASCRGQFDEVEAMFDARAWVYPPIVKVKGKSVSVARQFSPHYFDFLYLDGDHQHDAVVADIAAYIDKVKPDGFIGGHDWGWSDSTGKLADAVRNSLHCEPELFSDGNWLIRRVDAVLPGDVLSSIHLSDGTSKRCKENSGQLVEMKGSQ